MWATGDCCSPAAPAPCAATPVSARFCSAGVWAEVGDRLGGVPALEARVLEWQRAGVVDASWSADDLFIALLGLCEIWHLTPFASRGGEETQDRRRAFVVHVAQLVGTPR
ncbi:hypothetical protein C5C34_00870 [Rathayibacter rathayi]|nr:hypothetical protein C5C34_00870 [Rathayibacter rathayi]PPG71247.1 hypothetical protein C5C02_02955 [Rathayibacter rathayi]PPG78325.1 hypothetical protein C5C23_02715 [Rathayibacter rathayi]PPI75624.1 hypothetical protein C5E12_00815 [Rathayibacter rathayi]PPI78024.1 hypothetical protein C5E03_01310 [Rathayibacter rathayi]